jgi:hypothetical protein
MRIAVASSILALGVGTTAVGQEAPDREQRIAELQRQLDAMAAQLKQLQGETPASQATLEEKLDGAVRQSPSEALREPRRLNISAPSLEGLDITGMLRIRGDGWANYGGDGTLHSNDILSFGTEAALSFNAKVSEKTSVRITGHFKDVWGDDVDHGASGIPASSIGISSDNNELEATEAYLSVHDMYESGVDFTAGRQIMQFGSERIVGDDEWRLTRTVLDGIRFDKDLGEGVGRVSFFGARLNDNDTLFATELVATNAAGDIHDNSNLYGFFYTTKRDDLGTIDGYFFMLDDPNTHNGAAGAGRTRVSTYGARWLSPSLGGVTVDGEFATQFGKILGDNFENYGFGTYAIHAGANWAAPEGTQFFRGVHVAYDYATGGDELHENFVTMLPTLHGWFGITDMFTWSNINHLTFGADFDTGMGMLAANYHLLRLASDDAGISGYNFSGTPAATGQSHDLGQEVDFVLMNQCTKSTDVGVGLGYLFVHEGLEDLGSGRRDMVFMYLVFRTHF